MLHLAYKLNRTWNKILTNTEAIQVLIGLSIHELQPIVCDQHIWNPKTYNDILSKELMDSLGSDVC